MRVFFCTAGQKIVLLLNGYDKGEDDSTRRQQKEVESPQASLRVQDQEELTSLCGWTHTRQALGLQFHDVRVAMGLTQKELAVRAGVPQADISRIERGAGNPTEATLQTIGQGSGPSASPDLTSALPLSVNPDRR